MPARLKTRSPAADSGMSAATLAPLCGVVHGIVARVMFGAPSTGVTRMRMGLAIDASCDLPQAFIEEHDIAVMPIAVNIDKDVFKDNRDPAEIQRFFDLKMGSRSHSASTEPCSVEDVQKLFLEKLVLEKDCVFCLTITATRSPINDHVIKASFAVLKHYREVRDQTTMPGPFLIG
jgi:hypothetical protein